MVVYDYKFPTLATKLYYHYLKNKNAKDSKMPHGMKFNIINFVDVEYSRRVNPIQLKYINNLAAASETAETLLESLQKGKKEGGGGSDQSSRPLPSTSLPPASISSATTARSPTTRTERC